MSLNFRCLVSTVIFLFSFNVSALEAEGAPAFSKVPGKNELVCASDKDLNQYDHGVIVVQFEKLAIVGDQLEAGLLISRQNCQKDISGTIAFVEEDPFAPYSFEFPTPNVVFVQPLQLNLTLFDAKTFEVLGKGTLLPGATKNHFEISMNLSDLLSSKNVTEISGGKKIEKKIGLYVNQLSDYTNQGKTTKINNKYQLKTSFVFF